MKLNAVLGDPIDWLPDNKTIIVKTVPAGRGPAPTEPRVPKGPHVQESDGNAAGVATYEDLLQNPHDEELYEYYATAQLVSIDTASSKVTPIGKPAIFEGVTLSTDGKYMLVTREHRPFDYLHPAREFPKEVEIWNQSGAMIHKVASIPTPKTASRGGGVPPGPRQYRWLPNEPASLLWVEALDGGNPREKVPHRDRVVALRRALHRRAFRNRENAGALLRHPVRQGFRAGRRQRPHHAHRADLQDRSEESFGRSEADLEPQFAGSL